MTRIAPSARLGHCFGILLLAAAWAGFAGRDAAASIVFSISPVTTTVAAGSSGDAFNVTLTNTGPTSVSLGAFAFELTSSPLITFTDATTSTSPAYIFASGSLFGPVISTSSPGSVLDASDDSSLLAGATVAAGGTVGLGHVLFSVSASAPTSDVAVNFTAYPVTSLADASGDNVPITSLTGGTIDIQGNAQGTIPEPSAWIVWAGFGALGLIAYVGRRQKRAA